MPLGFVLLAQAAVAVIAPPEVSEELRSRAVVSCESVLGTGSCVVPGVGAPEFLAEVEWNEHRLTITLRRREAPETVVATTRLDFSPQDEPDERWVATGLMIAALAAAQPRAITPAPEPVRSPLPPPASPREPPAPPPPVARPWLLALEAGGLLGPGADRGAWRQGGLLRLELLPPGRVGMVGGARVAIREGPPDLQWIGGELGPSWQLSTRGAPLALVLRALGVLEVASARQPDGEAVGTAAVARGGARAGALGIVRWTRGVTFWVGGEATLLRPALEVQVHDRTVSTEGPLRAVVTGGIRLERTFPHRPAADRRPTE